MSDKHLCPICSSSLLCQISHGKLGWYCVSCHQEVPYGICEQMSNSKVWKDYDQIKQQLIEPNLFYSYLKQEWQRLSREKQELSLILCEIDDFVSLHKSYGEQIIGICLEKVGQTIKQEVKRPADLVARYQLGQFAILLPNTNSQGALEVVRRIQTRIRNLNFENIWPEISQYITLSFGVTGVVPDRHTSVNILLVKVEEALQKAKLAGQDQIITDRIATLMVKS
jgi:diguanylate cyclase (GGDEF)-like protein